MVLSLQAIDFLLASSIQDGCPLSDIDCNTDGSVGDDDGDEGAAGVFRSHFSSRGLSGTLVGLDSTKTKAWVTMLHMWCLCSYHRYYISTHLRASPLVFPLASCLCFEVAFWTRPHRVPAFLLELSSIPPEKKTVC